MDDVSSGRHSHTMYKSYFKKVIETGFSIARFGGYEVFRQAMDAIGQSINVTNVKLGNKHNGLLNSLNAMPLHTDHPDADIIGWYCVEQSDDGGSSLLADLEEIKAYMTPEIISVLSEIEVVVPDFQKRSIKETCPIISEKGIYYASWLVRKSLDRKHGHALKAFQAALNRTNTRRIKLNEGEALIINNRRMLHGRERIIQQSKNRHLIRHWVSLKNNV